MFKISMATRNAQLLALAATHNGGVLRMYTGDIPATAEASIGTAVLKATISLNGTGTGISFEAAPVDGLLSKATAETWLGSVVASGDFSFYRFSAISDTGAESTTEPRLQGTIGVLNEDLLVSDISKAIGEDQRVDSFFVGMPASAA